MKVASLLATGLLLLLAVPVRAQAPFAVLSAEADYVNPFVADDTVSIATPADWAAAGYQAQVSAESRDTDFSPPQNVAKSAASFFQPEFGNASARQYGYNGAYYHVGSPTGSSTASEISSQWHMTVTPLTNDPFVLKGFMTVHGLLSAMQSSQMDAASAIAYAFSGIRMVETQTQASVTDQGEIWARNSLGPEQFTVETNGIFTGYTTLREGIADPEGLYTNIKAVELSRLLVYDLPGGIFGGIFGAPSSWDYEMTFFQRVETSLRHHVEGKLAFVNLNNTTNFGVFAANPQTGEEIPNAIRVEIFAGGNSAAAPEPGTVALVAVGFGGVVIVVRRRARWRL